MKTNLNRQMLYSRFKPQKLLLTDAAYFFHTISHQQNRKIILTKIIFFIFIKQFSPVFRIYFRKYLPHERRFACFNFNECHSEF